MPVPVGLTTLSALTGRKFVTPTDTDRPCQILRLHLMWLPA